MYVFLLEYCWCSKIDYFSVVLLEARYWHSRIFEASLFCLVPYVIIATATFLSRIYYFKLTSFQSSIHSHLTV